ncbi:hypothetical protein O0881_21095 [Janthinobacterium sp. SUN100]|uniref:hypothetical protein n=1 Tax=Janthinobacterium sp. SUN100 TaxID=3004101 RepID=UPI0025AF92DA|nr:hypothetical protein [Janthinobacterium sp. SUN100]MDN2704481.1 hypothetical protein [Janthinobacterium sp. SUN100]
MTILSLEKAMRSVNWNENVEFFLQDQELMLAIDHSCQRIAIWAKQLENIDSKNPAISFVRAMQICSQHAVTTMGLAIYKASAASIRGIVENALYYTYFRTHHVELASLLRDANYYISKGEILSFHKLHTPYFSKTQEKLGLLSRIENWYSAISAIVHGQVPGIWTDQKGIGDTKTNIDTLRMAVKEFCEGERIVHELFLLTVGKESWDDFSHTAKKALLAGIPGEQKEILKLDKH